MRPNKKWAERTLQRWPESQQSGVQKCHSLCIAGGGGVGGGGGCGRGSYKQGCEQPT